MEESSIGVKKYIMFLNDRLHGRTYLNYEGLCQVLDNLNYLRNAVYKNNVLQIDINAIIWHKMEAAGVEKSNPKYNFYQYYMTLLFHEYSLIK